MQVRGLVQVMIIGRAMRRETATRFAEAEMSAACLGLGRPPHVGLSFRSADGSDNPIPRAASALVELAMTCPGLFYFATSWLPDGEKCRHHLLHNLYHAGELQLDSRKSLAYSNGLRGSDEVHWKGAQATALPLRWKSGFSLAYIHNNKYFSTMFLRI